MTFAFLYAAKSTVWYSSACATSANILAPESDLRFHKRPALRIRFPSRELEANTPLRVGAPQYLGKHHMNMQCINHVSGVDRPLLPTAARHSA